MKQFLFLLFIPIISFSQKNFAPLGAVWNYEGKSEWSGVILACPGNHIQYVVEEEVLINGRNCSLVRSYRSTDLDTTWRYTQDSLIVWEDDSQIYFLQDSSFLLLFDFTAGIGDTVVRYDPLNRGAFSGTYYADSSTVARRMDMRIAELDSLEIQGKVVTIQTMVNLDPDSPYWMDEVLNGVGSLSQSFSGDYYTYVADGCNGELICYKNGELEYLTPNRFSHPHPACEYNPFTDAVEDKPDHRFNFLLGKHRFSETDTE